MFLRCRRHCTISQCYWWLTRGRYSMSVSILACMHWNVITKAIICTTTMHYGLWTLCIRFFVGEDAAASIESLVSAIGDWHKVTGVHILEGERIPSGPSVQLYSYLTYCRVRLVSLHSSFSGQLTARYCAAILYVALPLSCTPTHRVLINLERHTRPASSHDIGR